ncbi:tRNA (adenosine(37)-N6)-threonylcarbamoyltransferase complex dimerization subunit type 1 TsaB [Thalassotalea crassostreae]|uniref:tRNA (adenosine(37)-N6)-threonylcarbamoyltransferase complex dimerization subunit type 1 TsaB n=1 Tax=Thalassotalea crassostreae TaxID=1763536 RepID=UPI0008396867|nr:tRNA (adenosine(37)-N6)-threonylcarbamoyltransferase complex dimerization subunit type 1 TsaB [Thalassotalea crassostreae]
MNYLAIDASTEACSVALRFNDKTYSRYELCPQSHSLMLLPMVDEVLKEAGVKLNQLDGLVYGRGPGSFTGVRIGIGVAQGLAFAANLPVVGVSTLQAMAQAAYMKHGQSLVLSAIDARMSETYSGLFRLDQNNLMQAVVDEVVMAPEKLHDHFVEHYSKPQDSASAPSATKLNGVGSAWNAYAEQLANIGDININDDIEFPTAEAMLEIGAIALDNGDGVSAEHAQPVYLRDTVTWKKLPGRE